MREPRRGERLAVGAVVLARRSERDPLDRDFAPQELVVCAPNHAEPARAELLGQPVAAQEQLPRGRPAARAARRAAPARRADRDPCASADGMWGVEERSRGIHRIPYFAGRGLRTCEHALTRRRLTENLQESAKGARQSYFGTLGSF